jgi:hypothetical protein
MKLLAFFLVFIVSACATAPNPVAKQNELPASESLRRFYGEYLVQDARLNSMKITMVKFQEKSGVPTLSLYASETGTATEVVSVNDCSGFDRNMTDGSNRFASIYCYNKIIGSRKPARVFFSVSDRKRTEESGSMISAFTPMDIPAGNYHLQYNSGDSRMDSHFSLTKK